MEGITNQAGSTLFVMPELVPETLRKAWSVMPLLELPMLIIPTVFREDYLMSLKAMSHHGDATAYMRVMSVGQAWASELDYEVGVFEMNQQLDRCNAKQEDTRLFRLLSPRTMQPLGAQLRPPTAVSAA